MNTPSDNNPNTIPLGTHLKKGELFSLRCENFENESVSAFNRHDHLELILVEEGTLGCFVDGSFFTAVAGELVIINPLQTHRLIRGITDEPLLAWILTFNEALLPAANKVWTYTFEQLIKDVAVIELFRSIIREKKQALAWNNLYIQNLIQLILLQLLRKHTKTSSQENGTPPLLQAVMSYIHEHYSQPLTLETIGSTVGISRWYLSKFFKKETGISIVEYINQYRCSNALALLLKSEHPISKISEMCGFSSLEYFSRVYTKQYGHAPSFERELQQNNDVSLGLFASSLAASAEPAIPPKSKKRSPLKKSQKKPPSST